MNAYKFSAEIEQMLEVGLAIFLTRVDRDKIQFSSPDFMNGLVDMCHERANNIAMAYADRVLDEKHVDNTGNCTCRVCQ